MKKIICGLVAVLLAASLFGCSNSEEKGKTEPSTVSSEAETSSVDTSEDDVQSESSMYVASEVSNRGIGILSVNDDVYVADSTGVWEKSKDSNTKEYITDHPSTFIASDGNTILYVYKTAEPEPAQFYAMNAEIHSINIDGSNDKTIIECNDSAQPLLISNNKLYYADFATNESFHRELFAVDLNSGEKESLTKDVSYPKLFENQIYCSEGGFLQDTENGVIKVYDVINEKLEKDVSVTFENLYDYAFVDGAVVYKDDSYYYKSGTDQIKIDGLNSENESPVYVYDGIIYYVSNNTKVEMKKM